MKTLLVLLLTLCSFSGIHAQAGYFAEAVSTAKAENKLILLNFSGSDWCIPCIRMEKEIFNKKAFRQFANTHLVMLRADFPRLKKNQLPAEQKKENDALAERYNKRGSLPYTVLLNAEGKVVKEWDGIVANSATQFVRQLKMLTNAPD